MNRFRLESLLSSIIFSAVIAAGIFVAYMQSNLWIEAQKDTLKKQAVQDCMKVATYTTESEDKDGTKYIAAQPIKELYRFCMTEKGY